MLIFVFLSPPSVQYLSIGVFELIASLVIFVMGVTMLRLDRAKVKWRVKLQHAFQGDRELISLLHFTVHIQPFIITGVDKRTKSGKWVLFILPFITVLREGIAPSSSSSLDHIQLFSQVWKLSSSSVVYLLANPQHRSPLLPSSASSVV